LVYYYRSYDHPEPSIEHIDECCLAFHTAISQGLKSSGVDAHIYIPFRLDVWRYLTRDKGRGAYGSGPYLLEKHDFERFSSLPNHWYYVLNQHGEGAAVDFPMKVRPLLGKAGAKNFIVDDNGTLCKAPISYIEKISIYFVKRACNVSNI
jgi:hypothetical protein